MLCYVTFYSEVQNILDMTTSLLYRFETLYINVTDKII